MIGCIIQARIGSKSLPEKILKKLDEKTVLDYVIEQTKNSKKIDRIVIATTNLKEDNVIQEFCQNRKIDCFRGSVDDVLDRHYQCAKKYSFKTIVRITSDNPVVDPEIIDLAIKKYQEGQNDIKKLDKLDLCNKCIRGGRYYLNEEKLTKLVTKKIKNPFAKQVYKKYLQVIDLI